MSRYDLPGQGGNDTLRVSCDIGNLDEVQHERVHSRHRDSQASLSAIDSGG